MDLLDQADIDALLSSGSVPASDASADSTAASPPRETRRPDRTEELPAQFTLAADEDRLARLLPIRMPVQVRLAERHMNIGQLLDLTPGTIIEFDQSADSDLDLVANNIPIGTGNAVKCGERFGLRVIKILPWAQRLLSQGLIR